MNICYNVLITFSTDERDLLPASIRFGADFKVYPQFSQIEDRVASLKDFCTASTKRIFDAMLITQI